MPTVTQRKHEPMPHTHARHLLNPLRSLVLSPKALVRRLDLRPDSIVLELGPGPGYFSPAVARAVPEGRLVLVDVQQEMLDIAKERLEGMGIGNVDYRRADAISLPAENGAFDVAFLVAVLGEVSDRGACLREIRRVLRADGLLSITEFKLGDPDFIPLVELLASIQSAGFRRCAQHGVLFHYTVSCRKAA
jgi:ubiquinone/menaquinone biosynthesis C-methylase UbiE